MISGSTVVARKKSLAAIVAAHLNAIGETAKVVEARPNSEGHLDVVVVESSIGLVHLTASVSKDPNASMPVANFKDGRQAFLADKAYIAFGWNAKDDRTLVFFVQSERVRGKDSLTKAEIRSIAEQHLNAVLTNSPR